MMVLLDPLYLAMLIPTVILAAIASMYTKSMFNRFSKVAASSHLTGAQAAEQMLRQQGVYDVQIEQVGGFLSDHYDPRHKTLRLSPNVYGSQSLSAIGVACHEAGHALQHAVGYAPLSLRSAMVPMTQFGSSGSYIFFIIGFLFHSPAMIQFGVILFAMVVVFSLVTLPVEWNASARAKRLMVSAGIVSSAEARQAGQVLNAAFLTYVASAVSALMTLLYYLIRFGMLGSDD
jgi:Zn-dependent membrane protease YugP